MYRLGSLLPAIYSPHRALLGSVLGNYDLGVCQGINMVWFFQGLERMRVASALEIGGKFLATLSIFALVHKPDDGWKVIAAQCVGCVMAHGVTVVLA
jgi:hypothetical protein